MTTKPSERIVVFVTPAQKLAIGKTADNLGISVSELMRRTVLNFNATSEQIKAAGIVDRLRAPKAPDPLDVALKSVAATAAAREAREAAASAAKNAGKRPVKPAPKTPEISAQNDHDDAEDSGEDAWLSGDGRS
ncbi:plasmid mobilization protein [Candidatus Burkholderia verschuerenii]|uniref:plasmid mobilization protein n=1 Tax=Candidatus Burkholderia verschuerenii TaxID=242163 RepID=UPI00067BD365